MKLLKRVTSWILAVAFLMSFANGIPVVHATSGTGEEPQTVSMTFEIENAKIITSEGKVINAGLYEAPAGTVLSVTVQPASGCELQALKIGDTTATPSAGDTINITVQDGLAVSLTAKDVTHPVIDNITRDKSGWAKEASYNITVSDNIAVTECVLIDPAGNAASLSVNEDSTYTAVITEDGTYTVQVKDAAGLSDTKEISEQYIDTTVPSIDRLECVTPGVAASAGYEISVSDTQSGIANVLVKSGDITKNLTAENGVYRFAITSNDEYIVIVEDAAGNQTQHSVINPNIDITAPTISNISRAESGWQNGTVTYTFTVTDTQSEIKEVSYRINEGEKQILSAVNEVYSFQLDSNCYVLITATDNLGNTATMPVSENQIDMIAPSIADLSRAESGWKKTATYTFVATDDLSGIGSVSVSIAGGEPVALTGSNGSYSFQADANGMIQITVTDAAGNGKTTSITEGFIDSEGPAIANVVRAANGWQISSAYTFVVSDAQSGLREVNVFYNGAPHAVENDGSKYSFDVDQNGDYTIKATDLVGNEQTFVVQERQIDTTAPEVQELDRVETGWETAANYTFRVEETQSGIAVVHVKIGTAEVIALTADATGLYTFKLEDNKSYRITVTDQLGNTKTVDGQEAMIDISAPEISTPVRKNDSWLYSAPYKFKVTETQSGIVAVTVQPQGGGVFTLSPDSEGFYTYIAEANNTFTVKAIDAVGNIAQTTFTEEKVDITAPTISNANRDPDHWSTNAEYVFITEDLQSGVASVIVTLNDSPVVVTEKASGEYSFDVSANGVYQITVKDAVGNKATVSVTEALIDQEAPQILNVEPQQTWDAEKNTVTMSVTDESELVSVRITDASGTEHPITNTGADLYQAVFTQNGDYTVSATDRAGNSSSVNFTVWHIDTAAPTTPVLSSDANEKWVNTDVFLAAKSIDDQSGVTAYWYSTQEGPFDKASWAKMDANTMGGYLLLTAEQNLTYYVVAEDVVGRISDVASITVSIDKTVPEDVMLSYSTEEGSGYRRIVNGKYIYNDHVSFTASAEDTASGVVKYEYRIVGDNVSTAWFALSAGEEGISPVVNNLPDGVYSIYVRVTDLAGNCTNEHTVKSNGGSVQHILENTPCSDSERSPVPDVEMTTTSGNYVGEWTSETVTVSVSGSAAVSGIEYYEMRVDHADPALQDTDWEKVPVLNGNYTFDISTDTNATYFFRAVTYAGNHSNVIQKTVRVQKSIPIAATLSKDPATGTNGWHIVLPEYEIHLPEQGTYTAPVHYVIAYDHNGEEKEDILYNGQNAPKVSQDGIWNIQIIAIDAAGNTNTVEESKLHFEVETETSPAPDVSLVTGEERYDGSWTNQTVSVNVAGSSALSGIAYYEYRITHANPEVPATAWKKVPVTNGKYTFNIDTDTNAVYYFRAVTYAGNYSLEMSRVVRVQKSLPAAATMSKEAATGTHNWHTVLPKYDISLPTQAKYGAPVHYVIHYSHNGIQKEQITYSGQNAPAVDKDGLWDIQITAVDAAGNTNTVAESKLHFEVDTVAPTETDVLLNGSSILNSAQGIHAWDQVHISNKSQTSDFTIFLDEPVVIEATAQGGDSGMAAIYYQLVAENEAFDLTHGWLQYTEKMTLQPDLKSHLFFKAVDRAGNTTYFSSDSFILDNTAPSGVNSEALTLTPRTANLSKHGYYFGDITVDIQMQDPMIGTDEVFSGLRSVSYRVYNDGTLSQSGQLYPDGGVAEQKQGRTYSWNGSLTVDAEKNNSNHVVVEVIATDMAGNTTVSRIEDGVLRIDLDKPVIVSSYDRNDVTVTIGGIDAFTGQRILTVSVNERNFIAEESVITVMDTDTGKKQLYQWKSEEDLHTAVIPVTKDGHYQVSATVTDAAGNNSTIMGFVTGTRGADAFVIDNTAPVIQVSYDNNSVKQDLFFDGARTAMIQVEERNFDPHLIDVEASLEQEDGTKTKVRLSDWTSSGNVHTAYLTCEAEGIYTVSVTGNDQLGNTAGIRYSGSATQEFVVDTHIDAPVISDVSDGTAYAATVIPKATVLDKNLDKADVKLLRTRRGEIDVDVTEELLTSETDWKAASGGLEAVFDVFSEDPDTDGIYTLIVSCEDKAGNTNESSVTFSVNRFGSVYVYDAAVIETRGAYLQNMDRDLIIKEHNPSGLVAGSARVSIIRDGEPVSEPIYTVTPVADGTEMPGESGWYEYQYVISADNFKEDGAYEVIISTEDAAGNIPENTDEDMAIRFAVDTQAPELTSIVGLEEEIYKADSIAVALTALDNIALESIVVYLNGEELTRWDELTGYAAEQSFRVPSGLYQHIRLVVTDKAGNIVDTDAADFTSGYVFNKEVTVSTNALLRFYANKPLFFGTLGGVALIGGTVLFFILKKRRKDIEVSAN